MSPGRNELQQAKCALGKQFWYQISSFLYFFSICFYIIIGGFFVFISVHIVTSQKWSWNFYVIGQQIRLRGHLLLDTSLMSLLSMSPSWLLASQRTVTCCSLKKVTWLRTWLVLRATVTLVWMLSSSGSAVSSCHEADWLLHLQVGSMDAAMAVNGQRPPHHHHHHPGVRYTTLHRCWKHSLEHAVAAVPLYGGGRDPLSDTRHQVILPVKVVVRQLFNLSRNYKHRRYYLQSPSCFFLNNRRKET